MSGRIKSCPAAITSLKYFCEDAQEYLWPQPAPFWASPQRMGPDSRQQINSVNLFPLSFTEFLGATGNGRYAELIERATLR
ncbi:MAG: hypothetical protein ACLTXI_01280 [Collinsella sp.]